MTPLENATVFQRQYLAEPSARAKRSELYFIPPAPSKEGE